MGGWRRYVGTDIGTPLLYLHGYLQVRYRLPPGLGGDRHTSDPDPNVFPTSGRDKEVPRRRKDVVSSPLCIPTDKVRLSSLRLGSSTVTSRRFVHKKHW